MKVCPSVLYLCLLYWYLCTGPYLIIPLQDDPGWTVISHQPLEWQQSTAADKIGKGVAWL